jgi:septal ring factor EnvC (AmiA/AmiB activator)
MARDAFDTELISNRNKIKQLKIEIIDYNKRLGALKNQANTTAEQLALIDEEIALISRTKGLLEQQRRILEKRIYVTNSELKDTESRLLKLENLYTDRIRYAYKHGRIKNIELILTSSSFNQALVRYKYLKAIADQDERTIKNIRRKKDKIIYLRSILEKDLQSKTNTIQAKKNESRTYSQRKNRKKQLLKKIKNDQKYVIRQIQRKEKEQEELSALIVKLEHQKKMRQQRGEEDLEVAYNFKDFSRARGKLIWPVKGKIISRYGKQKDPISKTTIKNTDIEISSSSGTPVRSVFDGAVRMITYLSSYGNTVIVDHGGGYYTVYSHLDEIYVNKGDFIKAGETIATVGDSGSLTGPKLQFGIYGEKQTYNPEKWLGG